MEQAPTISKRFKAWLSLSRPPFHLVGLFPFFLGATIAWSQGYLINWAALLLSAFAVALIMLTTYYSGEYYDYETDSINVDYDKFSGGTRVLPEGLIPHRQALVAAYLSLFLAVAIGLVLHFYYKTGPWTLPLGAFGLFCGLFYTSKPIQWAYRGIGEVLIGICYGWLAVNASYYLQTQHFGLLPTLVSVPIAISIFLVILINEFPDYTSDKISGKRNLVVRLEQERAATLYTALLIACFLTIVLSLFYGVPWLAAPLSLIALFLILMNLRTMRRREWKDRKTGEALRARTYMLNLAIAIIYIIAFVWSQG